jgi:hypothetical protein
MTWAAELQTLESEFATNWGATTPVQYENDAAFTPPSDQADYAMFQILQGQSEIVGGQGGGNGKYRHRGVIQIDLYTSEGEGSAPALTLADTASAIFRGKRIGDVICRAPAISKPVSDGGYFRVTVSINYQRDETL